MEKKKLIVSNKSIVKILNLNQKKDLFAAKIDNGDKKHKSQLNLRILKK